ncbi:MAG: hypothetical protein J6B48_02655 [Clostridia bacterium]|nr:hypothetical protein [Clostridia bacterium]MBO5315310.1 hypothetical protein [Clostridia bacterium]
MTSSFVLLLGMTHLTCHPEIEHDIRRLRLYLRDLRVGALYLSDFGKVDM